MGAFQQFIITIMSYYEEFLASTDPLAARAITTIIAITLYAIFAGSFYETLSKKKIFRLHIPRPTLFGHQGEHIRLWDIIVFFLQYTLGFPLITLIWTIALTLFLLSLSTSPAADVAVLSLSIVAATRIVAYYDEKIAIDVAKLLPIALLAIVVSDPGSLSLAVILERANELVHVVHEFAPLFIFLVIVEWSLRLSLEIKYYLFGRPQQEEDEIQKIMSNYKPKKNK